MTQIDVYAEERFEDEEDMREHAQDTAHRRRPHSESELVLDELINVAKAHHEVYPLVIDILKRCCQILNRDDMWVQTCRSASIAADDHSQAG